MKVIRWLDNNLEEFLMVLLLFGIAAVMILQVFTRYVLNYSMSWSDELVRYFLVWSCFLSVSFCVKKRISIKIESVLHALPEKIRPWLRAVRHLIVLIFCILMIPFAVTYIRQAVASGATSAAMQIPMYYIQSAPLIGFILLAIRCFQALIREVKAGVRGPEIDEAGHVINSADDGFVQDIIEVNVEEEEVVSAVNEVREELGEEPLTIDDDVIAAAEEAAEEHAFEKAAAEQKAAEKAVEEAGTAGKTAEQTAEEIDSAEAAEQEAGQNGTEGYRNDGNTSGKGGTA